jgi:hypothetical protein
VGLSSGDFSVSFQQDGTSPSVSPVISGTSGSGGWYITSVTASSSGSDAVSGILLVKVSVDGGGWQDSAALTDGTYTVVFAALDGAGNEASTTRTIQVDATVPTLGFDLGGSSPNADGWYTSPVSAGLTVGDALSGLSIARLRVDGGAWADWSGTPIPLGAGTHLLEAEAQDAAGNTASASMEVKVRNPPPKPSKTPTARLLLPTRTPTPTITTTKTLVDTLYPTSTRSRTPFPPTASPTNTQVIAPVLPPESTGGLQNPQQKGTSLPLLPLAIAAAGASLALSAGITRSFVNGPIAQAVRISPADAPIVTPGGYSREEDLARKKAEKQAWVAGQSKKEAQNTAYQAQHASNLAAAAGVAAINDKQEDDEEAWLKKKTAVDKAASGKGIGIAAAKPSSNKGGLSAGMAVTRGPAQSNSDKYKAKQESKSLLASIPLIGNTLDKIWQSTKQLWDEKVSTPINNLLAQEKPTNKPTKTVLAVGGALAMLALAIGVYSNQQGSVPTRDHQDPWWCAYAPNFGISGKKCLDDFLAYEQGIYPQWQVQFLATSSSAIATKIMVAEITRIAKLYPTPTVIYTPVSLYIADESKLTKRSREGNGIDLYKFYKNSYNDPTSSCWDDDACIPEKLLGQLWGYELDIISANPELRLEAYESYKEALVRSSVEFCKMLPSWFECDLDSIEGVMSFHAYYSESVHDRLYEGGDCCITSAYVPGPSQQLRDRQNLLDGIEIVKAIMTMNENHPEWATGLKPDRPYSIGNGSMFSDEILLYIVENKYYYWASPDVINPICEARAKSDYQKAACYQNVDFILNGCQYYYVQGMMDEFNIILCKPPDKP